MARYILVNSCADCPRADHGDLLDDDNHFCFLIPGKKMVMVSEAAEKGYCHFECPLPQYVSPAPAPAPTGVDREMDGIMLDIRQIIMALTETMGYNNEDKDRISGCIELAKLIRVRLTVAPTPVAGEPFRGFDDCGNCLYKMTCKFSPIAVLDVRVSECTHWKCCYENGFGQAQGGEG